MRKLALLAILGVAATCTPKVPRYSFKYAEKRGTLEKNGLRFVIAPDATTKMVELDVRYDVGSREDPPGKAGLAHLVEHLMFQQRPDGPTTPPLMTFLNQLTTYFNAFTVWDTTHYQQAGRAANLDAMLKVEAMRMYYRCKTIPEVQFEREREVVRNEIRWRTGNAAGQMQQMILSSVYPKGHAYARDVGGNDEQIAHLTLKDACDFMDKYYTPDRAVVVIAGGVDVDDTVKDIKKWFGNIPKRTPAPRVPVAPVTIQPGRVDFKVDIERPMVHVAWVLPPFNTPEGEAALFGINSVFFDTADKAQKYGFATQVEPQFYGGELAPVFVISIELKGMDKLDEALDFVKKSAKQAHRGFDMIPWQQLQNLKNLRKANFIEGIERLDQRTLQIAEAVQFDKDMKFSSGKEYIINEMKKIDDFDGDRVRDAVKKALDPNKAKIIVIHNTKEGVHGDKRADIAFQPKSDTHKEVPEVDPAEAFRPLKVAAELTALSGAKRFTLDNGMHVVLLPVDSFPVVSAQLQFKVGRAAGPRVAAGAAQFLHLPMDAEKMRAAGISVGCKAGNDTTVCGTSGVKIYLDIMINSLERLITAGDYDQKGIEDAQKAFKDDIKRQKVQTDFEFNRQIANALYGPDHPYTKAVSVTPEMFSHVGHDDFEHFKNEHYTAANATLIIAGNFDPAKAEGLIRGSFGHWGHGHQDPSIPPTQRQRTGPEYIGVTGKDEPQTTIRIVYPAPAGMDGQQGARLVLAQMLNERMEDIRFKLGSTYGTYAGQRTSVGPSSYEMGGDVDTARTGESLKAMREGIAILQHVAAGSATDAETKQFMIDFVRARRKVIQELLGESTVSSSLVQRLSLMETFGLGPDFYNQTLQRVAAVSPAQIKGLIASELKVENEIIATKGTREGIEKTFTGAGLTNFKIVEPEYK
jgi:zinc protease